MNNDADVLQDETPDVADIVRKLWSRRWWVLSSVLLIGIGFAVYAFLATPIYRASVVFVSASQDRNRLGSGLSALAEFGGLAEFAGVSIGASDTDTEEGLAVMRSRQFIESFISDNDLMPVLFPEKWNARHKIWPALSEDKPSRSLAYRRMSEDILSIVRDKKTGLISFDVEWRDREQAAHWANEIIERINEEMRSRALKSATASIQYLQLELDKTSDIGTREAINRLIEGQVKKQMLANVNREFQFRVVDRAVTPEIIDKIRPKRVLLIVIGCVLGFVIGVGGVLIAHKSRSV